MTGTTTRRLAVLGMAAATAMATLAAVAPAQAAHTGTKVAVTSPNGKVYARTSGISGWRDLGGVAVGAPAVAYANGLTHYIVQGSNSRLYHRTDVSGWAPLSAAQAACSNPTAVTVDSTVHVACRGGNAALYTLSFPGAQQTPYVASPTKLGGEVVGSTAIAASASGPIFFSVGVGYEVVPGSEANTYIRTLTEGFSHWDTYCASSPAAVNTSTGFFFACQFENGVVAVESSDPSDVSASGYQFYDVAGQTVGTPSLVATGDGSTAQLYVQGSDAKLYDRPLSHMGPLSAGWTRTDGVLTGGVGAASPRF